MPEEYVWTTCGNLKGHKGASKGITMVRLVLGKRALVLLPCILDKRLQTVEASSWSAIRKVQGVRYFGPPAHPWTDGQGLSTVEAFTSVRLAMNQGLHFFSLAKGAGPP